MTFIDQLLNFIAPLNCLKCGEEGDIVCDPCTEAELLPAHSCCFVCNKLTDNFSSCAKCKSPLKAVWVVSDYSSLPKSIISRYKYDATRSVGGYIATQMTKSLPLIECIVTSVPTASARIRSRGFDHCQLLAKLISNKRGLVYSSLLMRTNSSHQVGSSRSSRLRQTEDLFVAKKHHHIKGNKILLIDDVVTTGATLTSAAKELKRAGASEVYGLVFARKM